MEESAETEEAEIIKKSSPPPPITADSPDVPEEVPPKEKEAEAPKFKKRRSIQPVPEPEPERVALKSHKFELQPQMEIVSFFWPQKAETALISPSEVNKTHKFLRTSKVLPLRW